MFGVCILHIFSMHVMYFMLLMFHYRRLPGPMRRIGATAYARPNAQVGATASGIDTAVQRISASAQRRCHMPIGAKLLSDTDSPCALVTTGAFGVGQIDLAV